MEVESVIGETYVHRCYRQSIDMVVGVNSYPLVSSHITNWKDSPFVNGRTHYFDGAIFHSYVELPDGR